MNRNTNTAEQSQSRAIMKIAESRLKPGLSVARVLSKLPNWALVPSLVGLFGLLMTNVVVADPLPFVDEAAMLWALMSGMRVLGSRRRVGKDTLALQEAELEALELRVAEQDAFDADAFDIELDRPAPGQPLRPARQRI